MFIKYKTCYQNNINNFCKSLRKYFTYKTKQIRKIDYPLREEVFFVVKQHI